MHVLDVMPALDGLSQHCQAALNILQRHREYEGYQPLVTALEGSMNAGRSVSHRFAEIADHAKRLFDAMDFAFLFNPDRELLSIGYRGSDGNLDSNYYDLLASEARLASFVAIAKGDIPARHWFLSGVR